MLHGRAVAGDRSCSDSAGPAPAEQVRPVTTGATVTGGPPPFADRRTVTVSGVVWRFRLTGLPLRLVGVGNIGYLVDRVARDILVTTSAGAELAAVYAGLAVAEVTAPRAPSVRPPRPRRERLPVKDVEHVAAVERVPLGYRVARVALVNWGRDAGRNATTARRLADRIARRPLAYLPLALLMPGVTDLRPTFGQEVSHA